MGRDRLDLRRLLKARKLKRTKDATQARSLLSTNDIVANWITALRKTAVVFKRMTPFHSKLSWLRY